MSLQLTEKKSKPTPISSQLMPLWNNGGHSDQSTQQIFNASYNGFYSPITTFLDANATAAVHLVVLLTGHGSDGTYSCCEFLPTKHTFSVNGVPFEWKDTPGSGVLPPSLGDYGCAAQTPTGIEANGYGAWWLGRNGWCNGDYARPWVLDVTVAALGGATRASGTHLVKLEYSASMWNTLAGKWTEPLSPDGYIILSSQLAVTLVGDV